LFEQEFNSSQWFHGLIPESSIQKIEKEMINKWKGKFFVRLSCSRPSGLTITFVKGDDIQKVEIKLDFQQKWICMSEEFDSAPKDLVDCVESVTQQLKIPFDNYVKRKVASYRPAKKVKLP
jgi:hypothetical protein